MKEAFQNDKISINKIFQKLKKYYNPYFVDQVLSLLTLDNLDSFDDSKIFNNLS